MTQKPPEMPQEIYAVWDGEEGHDHPEMMTGTWVNGMLVAGAVKYVLALPKEDVERALEDWEFFEKFVSVPENIFPFVRSDFLKSKSFETIRRVLMANAGRGI